MSNPRRYIADATDALTAIDRELEAGRVDTPAGRNWTRDAIRSTLELLAKLTLPE